MSALWYITQRSICNRVKKALKRPITYVLALLTISYVVGILMFIDDIVKQFHFDSEKGFIILVSISVIYLFLSNFLMYGARQGVIFKPGDAHFIFTAPISPKKVLLHAASANYIASVCICFALVFLGIRAFHIEVWKILLFIPLFSLGPILEISLMIWLYISETISESVRKKIGVIIKIILFVITAVIVYYFWENGITIQTASAFFDWQGLQALPIVGWEIALYRLLFLEPTKWNLCCSVLYFITVVFFAQLAYRMKNSGEYYEDAAKFADTYAEVKRRQKSGEMVFGFGKKKRSFRQAKGNYQATGAKAIFYKQLLECKKEKYFIFSKSMLVSIILAAILCFSMKDTILKSGAPKNLVVLGILCYMTLVLMGDLGRWEQELKTPYLYLIPAGPIQKLWYSTLMEHIKTFVEGCLLCIPIGIIWKIAPLDIGMSILIYTVLRANRLYSKVIVQCFLGDALGQMGQNIVRVGIQSFILGLGVLVAVLAGIVLDMNLVFPIVLIYSMIITVFLGLIAAVRFDSMEQIG